MLYIALNHVDSIPGSYFNCLNRILLLSLFYMYVYFWTNNFVQIIGYLFCFCFIIWIYLAVCKNLFYTKYVHNYIHLYLSMYIKENV